MTEQELRERFETWKTRLGLDGWRIVLEVGGVEEPTSYMEIVRSPSYERAVLHVQPWMLGDGDPPTDVMMGKYLSDDFVEASLVHELLHLCTLNMRVLVRDDLEGRLHPDAYHQIEAQMARAEEQCVDRLAEALVKAFA